MTRSIRLRLIASILLVLLPVSAAAGWLLVQVFGDRLLRDLDVALDEEATTVAALLKKPTSADAMPVLVEHIAGETDLGVGKRIVVRRGDAVLAEAPPGADAYLRRRDPDLRVSSASTGPPGDELTVTVGVPATAALHATRRLRLLLLGGIPIALLLLTAGLWTVTRRALRPLEDAAQALEGIGIGDLAARLPDPGRDDEVGRMVAAVNRMLQRLDATVAQVRRLTADAAHELRTPIAVLRTGLEVALRRERDPADYRAALTDALHDSERLDRLAEDLLTLARLEALPPRPDAGAINVAETLHELADAFQGLAEQHGARIAVDAEPTAAVRGAAADLYRLFANLLDNALHHGRAGGRVEVRAISVGGRVEVTVADDGAGIPPEELARVFDRFARGRASTGTGLGLSIARAIAHAHGGDVTLANRTGGGCVATVTLPVHE